MESIDTSQTNENFIDEWIKQNRFSYSHMFKKYIQQCEKYDQLKTSINENLKSAYNKRDLVFNDESGKINWEVIQQFLPPGIDTNVREEFSNLSENEIRLCYLLFFKVHKRIIAKILPYKQSSIRSVLYKIKKKTGISDINKIFSTIIGLEVHKHK